MGKLLGLDYGEQTVGVALVDPAAGIPVPLETIRRERGSHLRRTFSRLEEIIARNDVEAVVVGLPLNMDGTEGERAEAAHSFAERIIRRTALPVFLQDERLTSVDAERLLRENSANSGKAEHRRKQEVDAVAAALILEDYLGRNNHGTETVI